MKFQCLAVLVSAASFLGCTQTAFQSQKSGALSYSVMGNGNASGNINQPGSGAASGNINQGAFGGAGGNLNQGSSGTAQAPGGTIPVSLVCSVRGSQETTSFQAAEAAGDSFALDVNGQPCTTNLSTITSLLESTSISVATLAGLCPSLVPASGTVTLTLLINGQQQLDDYNFGNGLTVLWDTNPQETHSTPDAAQAFCSQDASPLVIQIAQNPASPLPLNLSPDKPVLFDLLGQTDNHKKVLIPWFSNLDYRLLALPNASGEVLGIDQLFGNNTTGPDGLTAANGYAALAKYDGTSADGLVRIAPADGRIDKNDPVFSHLRVWLDKNFDGVVQPGELVSLSEVNIEYIDLSYSKAYPEVDSIGDEIRMKSVVGVSGGVLDLIFDLWFRYSAQ